jgi:hypothetical protein
VHRDAHHQETGWGLPGTLDSSHSLKMAHSLFYIGSIIYDD